jgi:hypothetical protein
VATITLFPKNEQKLQLIGLKDDAGVVITGALVKATMNDRSGSAVAEINNVTLADIGSGNYSYTVPATFNPEVAPSAQPYTCIITASVSGVLKLTINQAVIVSPRTS